MAKPNDRIYNVFDRNLYRYGNAGYSDVSNGEPLTTNSIIDPGQIGSGTITTTVTGTENWARYVPIVSDTVNIDITSQNTAQWFRVGNIVTISGHYLAFATNPATATSLMLSLPPQFTLTNHAWTRPYGVATGATINDSLSVLKVAFSGTSGAVFFEFTYQYSFEVI